MQPSVEVLQPVGVVMSAGGDQSNKNGGLVEDQSAVQITAPIEGEAIETYSSHLLI
jgi:hypothetical protein